jgi:hypothetical protein
VVGPAGFHSSACRSEEGGFQSGREGEDGRYRIGDTMMRKRTRDVQVGVPVHIAALCRAR